MRWYKNLNRTNFFECRCTPLRGTTELVIENFLHHPVIVGEVIAREWSILDAPINAEEKLINQCRYFGVPHLSTPRIPTKVSFSINHGTI
jgi:hypothetical protein